ncbi:MAG TPA: homoserine dehydrogenase [Candidatus Limnocylindria bacterium]|nr:homoserine dehydrogenase [Candidatus Limnocylindria bacterium]
MLTVGLLGFGTIGAGVVRLLREHRAEIARRAGMPIRLVSIADLDVKTDRGVDPKPARLTTDAGAVLQDPAIDVVIELIGGYEPARRFVLAAIEAGKDVVTANKALLAVHGEEIVAAAERRGTRLGFEASVGGGIPILRVLKEGLAADRTTAVYGIVNGTCNHILTTMTREGRDFAEVLAEAQKLGLAEANPATDVDGIDSAHKLALLTTLAFGVAPRFADIPTEGIRHVSAVDIAFARELGYTIKLLAIAKDGRDAIEARVHPTMIPNRHLLADVSGNYNAIFVTGSYLGPTMYYGQGAGSRPTATAVVADLVAIARDRAVGRDVRVPPWGVPQAELRRLRIRPLEAHEGEYYLRFAAVDRPGVLGKLAGVLGRCEISIASVIQRERRAGTTVPLVLRTHRVQERNLRRALRAIERLDVVRGRPVSIRIEEQLA